MASHGQKLETGAMSVYQNSPVRIEVFSYVKVFVYPRHFITTWYVSERSIVVFLNNTFLTA